MSPAPMESNTQEHWDRKYANPEDRGRWNSTYRMELYRWATSHIGRRRATVADVGSGFGDGLAFLKEKHPHWNPRGLDYSQYAVENARVPTRQFDLLKDEMPGVYDYVLCIQTLEHFANPAPLVAKLLAASRRQLIITVPYRERTESHPEHCSSFDEKFFRQFGRCVIEVQGYRMKAILPRTRAEHYGILLNRARRRAWGTIQSIARRTLRRPARSCGDSPPSPSDRLSELSYTNRRYHIDSFYLEAARKWPRECRVLDLGGNKLGKRGVFNAQDFPVETVVANIATARGVDVLCDANALAFHDASFDIVICSELLEHVPCPTAVLAQCFRALRPGGHIVGSTPFLAWLHADPFDHARYTDTHLTRMLENAGFTEIQISKQGLFWTVFTDMIRDYVYQRRKDGALRLRFGLSSLLDRFVHAIRRRAIQCDTRAQVERHPFLSGYTTGFGFSATKPDQPSPSTLSDTQPGADR